MAQHINRLSATAVRAITKPGLHADGGGLYLSTTNGGKRWVFIFQWQGKRREMGLGSARSTTLARARELASQARAMVSEGIDPIAARASERAAAAAADPLGPPTFGEFSESYIDSVEDGWRNAKHRQQWRNSLQQHAGPLKSISVADIRTQDVLSVLQPIWLKIPETADRVRGRIEKVLNAAKAHGHRSPDSSNPAQWRGHLEVLLPKRQKLTRGHHAAMPYADVPAFWRTLEGRSATAARALAFLILTAARSGEVLGAKWGEIDGDLWIVPAERMKAGVQHSVALSGAAVAVLDSVAKRGTGDFIFAGQKGGQLSNMSMEMLLRRMDVGKCTVHGFRSAFKDWSLNHTEFPDEISEEALAHVVGSKVRRAYRRSEALDRRRALMEAWAEHVTGAEVKEQRR